MIMTLVLQDVVDPEVRTLLDLKAEYKNLTGVDLAGGSDGKKGGKDKKGGKAVSNGEKKEENPETKRDAAAEVTDGATGRDVKKITRFI